MSVPKGWQPKKISLEEELEIARRNTEHIRRENDIVRHMPWWKRLVCRLFRTRRGEYFSSGIDDHCFVTCACGEEFSASEWAIVWCSKCGLGYSTEFRVYQYPAFAKFGWKKE